MSTIRIKKGDTVRVIAGTDKGSEGKVIAVNHKKNTVLVEGVNMITKHTKPSPANQQGGIVRQEGPHRHFQRDVCQRRKSIQNRLQDGRGQESPRSKSDR